MGGRGSSSGISDKGKKYGTEYHTVYQSGNILSLIHIQMCIRDRYKRLNVVEIKEGELHNWDPLTEEITIKMIEDETERETAETLSLIHIQMCIRDSLHSLVKHLQIELENARLDLCIKNDAISGYKSENARLRPVSYTHLDVYKRQGVNNGRKN